MPRRQAGLLSGDAVWVSIDGKANEESVIPAVAREAVVSGFETLPDGQPNHSWRPFQEVFALSESLVQVARPAVRMSSSASLLWVTIYRSWH
jgi:Na+-transporting NADH:ubiquinone oxidoreductase subunit NqrB